MPSLDPNQFDLTKSWQFLTAIDVFRRSPKIPLRHLPHLSHLLLGYLPLEGRVAEGRDVRQVREGVRVSRDYCSAAAMNSTPSRPRRWVSAVTTVAECTRPVA